MKEIIFKCLRCGHEYVGLYDKKIPEEHTCPKCSSNSIRPMTKIPLNKS
ncbi:MAG: hypothetical protein V3S48_06770 [Candidatus Neomarinimicrobiota bacterium]